MKYAMCLKKKMTGKRNNKEEPHSTAALEDETLDLLLPLANRVPPKKKFPSAVYQRFRRAVNHAHKSNSGTADHRIEAAFCK